MRANLAFLTLRTFSNLGGVQRVCRSMCKTLSALDSTLFNVEVLSLYDANNDLDERYLPRSNFKGFLNHRISFLKYLIRIGLTTNILLLGHVNLLPAAMLIKLLHPTVKIILICHGTEIWRPLCWLKRIFLRQYVNLWSVSRYTCLRIMQQHQVPKRHIQLVPNSLDPFFRVPRQLHKPADLLEKYSLKDNCVVFLSLARMTKHDREKGYAQLIHLLPDLIRRKIKFCYLMAGEADETETCRLNRLIHRSGLNHCVKMIGPIPDELLVQHYLLADLFILPSKKEGFGLVFIEAAACGCDIICGKSDGSSAAVLHGQLGTMVDADNHHEFLETILNSLHSLHRPSTAQIQQERCLANFSYAAHSERVSKLLKPYLKS